jgi:hypothetical protein
MRKHRKHRIRCGLWPEFKTITGVVLEAEYFVSPNFGLKARVVQEKYEPKVGRGEANGKHAG